MTRELKKTIGTWRVLPLAPELEYASPTAARPRLRSGFGIASLLLGSVLAVAVMAVAYRSVPWSADDGDQIARAALPICIIGVGFGIVGSVRRSKRRFPGVLGLLVNLGVAVGVALLWVVTHVPA